MIREYIGIFCLVYSFLFAGGMMLAYYGQKTLAKTEKID